MKNIIIESNSFHEVLCGPDESIENFAILPWRKGLSEYLENDPHSASIEFCDKHVRYVLVQNIPVTSCYELCEKFDIEKFPYVLFDSSKMVIEFHLRKFMDNPDSVPVAQRYGPFLNTEKLEYGNFLKGEKITVLCLMCDIRLPIKTYIECSNKFLKH